MIDKSETKENDLEFLYESLFFENYSLGYIKKIAENNKSIEKLVIFKKQDKIIAYNKKDYKRYCIIFLKKIKVNYYVKTYLDNYFESEDIISTIQIEEKISKYYVKNVLFSFDGNSKKYDYNNEIVKLEYVNVNEIYIEIIIEEDNVYKKNDSVIIKNENIRINDLSDYFDKYFIYYQSEYLDYFTGEKRDELILLLQIFLRNSELNFLKICGPSNNGKSTTLLKFSRQHNNIVYFNLKALVGSSNDNDESIDFYSIIFYELKRIILDKDEGCKFSDFFNKKKRMTSSELICEVINYFINKTVVFILDQFKASTFDSMLYSKIEKNVLGSAVKIILCSSIDDGAIRNDLIHSIKVNRGNPKKLTKETQQYYFYFSFLFDYNLLKQLYDKNKYDEDKLRIYKKFNYDLKYKYKMDNATDQKKELKIIAENIKKKIKKNFSVDSEQILYNLSSKIGKELYYDNPKDSEILDFIPFKYYNLKLNDNCFIITYKFPLIQEIAMEWPKEKDIEDYFINKKYEDEFYGRFKGDYFEDYVKIFIDKNKDFLFQNKIDNYLQVDSIINLDDNQEDGYKIYGQSNIKRKKIYDPNDEKKYNEGIKQLIENEINNINKNDDYKNIKYYYKLGLEEKLKNKTFLGKKRYNIIEYSEEFKNGGILINQKNRNGEVLDQAVLLGKKENKIFIGLQIKFYSEKTKIDKDEQKKFEKHVIKNKLQNILSNSKIDFDISITEWHYIMILFFNPDTEHNKYSKYLVKMCQKKGLEYLFFNPHTNNLYDSSFRKIEKITVTNKSNLDLDININLYNVFKSFCEFDKIIMKYPDFKIYDFSSNEFSSELEQLLKNIKISSISVFIRTIENRAKLKNIKIIGLLECEMILFPKKRYGYFIKTTDNNILICYNNNNFINYFDYLNGKNITQDEFFKNKNDNKLYIIQISFY